MTRPSCLWCTPLLLVAALLPLATNAFVSSSVRPTTTTTTRPFGRSSSSSSLKIATTTTTETIATTPTVLPVQVVDDMPAWLDADGLHNHYYLLRHGQSTSNVEGIISSDRASLAYSTKHGLTELGIEQAQGAAAPLLTMIQAQAQPGDKVVFVASPFARAHQTAQACLEQVQSLASSTQDDKEASSLDVDIAPTVALHDALVERHFGRLDGQELFTYAYVWPLDKFNVTHTAFDVESVAAVCHRIRQCLVELEAQYQSDSNTRHHIVLTSHADVLQITQLYAAQASNVGDFSSFRFTNGEVRYMTVGSTADLPDPSPLPRPVRGTFIP